MVQEPPSGTLPQLFPTQVFGGVHWFSAPAVHTFVHEPPWHRPGLQLMFPGVTHVPLPLHVDGGVAVDMFGQVPSLHFVPCG